MRWDGWQQSGQTALAAVIVAMSVRWLSSKRSASTCRCSSGRRRCEHSSSNVIDILLYGLRMNEVAKPGSTLSVPRLGRCRLARGENAPSQIEKDYIV